ncbi:class I glutamine amidotransferase-like protein [Lophiotrema nucula]|uniref:Class I glutamine amidotransferase-like protein n=1 Tax=Lophiotrema nucula TaxID=690887 RepID=A0A6A5ZM73_9PLEO|nr:class I glutamine amidotransferase-like protein [Lophiotrema nucula]
MIRIGVLIVSPIQLLDIAPIDLFAMTTQSYFKACKLPQPLIDTAIPDKDLEINYIGLSGPGTSAATTANLSLQIDFGLDDAKVAPGMLDILMIPGPPPGLKPDEKVLEFVREHVKSGVDLLTICSGIFVAGFAGVLDDKHATGTRGVMDILKKEFPKVTWEDKRYYQDGKLWTSGGITNGMDMVATYLRYRWPGPLPETILSMADVDVRAQEYSQGQVGFTAWWVFHVFKAWVRGLTRPRPLKA